MPGNQFGQLLRLTTFGESHGPAIGFVLDGLPAGIAIDTGQIQATLARRRPGQSAITSPRNEKDQLEILSGLFESKTTGAPIAGIIRNRDHRPGDYTHLRTVLRPSHADFTYEKKYGHRDHRGSGRASARETAARVAAADLVRQWLMPEGVRVQAFVSRVGDVWLERPYQELDLSHIDDSPVRCPDPDTAQAMQQLIERVRDAGDTVGGQITGVISGLPIGLGEPVFDKFHADLGKAILSINACKGFDYGEGFRAAGMLGSQHNDNFVRDGDQITTETNHAGGILGGITNGRDVYFRAAFKPVSTLMQDRETLDIHGERVSLPAKGRHDPCVVPRAVPIVEAMAWLVIGDHWLRYRAGQYVKL